MPPVTGSPKRHFVGIAAMEELFGAAPPLMVDFSRELIALDPGDAGRRATIHEALIPALSRVSLVLKLASAESGSGESASDPDGWMVAG